MICPNCGHENNEGAKFCNECGTALVSSQSESDLSSVENNDSRVGEDLHKTAALDLPPVFESEEDPEDSLLLDEFDFGPIEDDDLSAGAQGDADLKEIDADDAPADDALAGTSSIAPDISGFDEYLVDSNYTPPQKSWKSGDTMEMPRVEGEAMPKQVEFRAPDANAKRSKGKVTAIVAVVIILIAALAVGGVTYQMEIWGGKSLPNVEGLSKGEATETLESCGFLVKVMEVKSDDTEDLVLLMDPGAGRRLSEGSEVVLQVATPRIIPEFAGRSMEEVKADLDEEGFERVEYLKVKSNEAENTVLSIDPVPGTKTQATTQITVTVAEPYVVPDVIGQDTLDAIAALEEAGYEVEEVYTYSEEAEYTVIETNPASGTSLASGSSVTIYIAKSRGSELVSATQSYLDQVNSLELNGDDGVARSYVIDKNSSITITYIGEMSTQAVMTVSGVTWIDGEEVRGTSRQRTVTFNWSDDNVLTGYY